MLLMSTFRKFIRPAISEFQSLRSSSQMGDQIGNLGLAARAATTKQTQSKHDQEQYFINSNRANYFKPALTFFDSHKNIKNVDILMRLDVFMSYNFCPQQPCFRCPKFWLFCEYFFHFISTRCGGDGRPLPMSPALWNFLIFDLNQIFTNA